MSLSRRRQLLASDTRPKAPALEPKAGVHEWAYGRGGFVCLWCGEAEATALSAGCIAVCVRDRDGQVFVTRILENDQIPVTLDLEYIEQPQ